MKRLVFFFDGTTNTLDARYSTNVVKLAQSMAPVADNVAQLIYYDRGVGSDAGEKVRGGAFGHGLDMNLYEAYSFLLFNYTPGDKIYVFGFSRGAFTARSFVGLVYNCGILRRRDAGDIQEAITFYRSRDGRHHPMDEHMLEFRRKHSLEVVIHPDEDAWRVRTVPNYAKGKAHLLKISYLGVWDTVAALGWPAHWWLARLDRRKYQFHDCRLSSFVESARHAVAIDERRLTFAPALWNNVAELNEFAKTDVASPEAPYQQKWFPGDHGSVGGGGDREGLSDRALDWIVDGARAAGLDVDAMPSSRIFEIQADFREKLQNVSDPIHPSLMERMGKWLFGLARTKDREGPDHLYEVDISACRRWLDLPENLQGTPYRPPTLDKVAAKLNALDPAAFGVGVPLAKLNDPDRFDFHTIGVGDSLRRISDRYYGTPDRAQEIEDANRDGIDGPGKLSAGRRLRIPKDPTPAPKTC